MKRKILLSAIVLMLGCGLMLMSFNSSQYSPPLGTPINRSHSLSKGLIRSYLLNEPAGKIAVNSVYTQNSNGTLSGAIYQVKQKGFVCGFNGTTDYIDIPDMDDMSFGNATTDYPFTISGWIYITNANATGFRMCGKTSQAGTTGNEYFCGTNGANPGLYVLVIYSGGNTGNNLQALGSSAAGDVNTWVYITFTYDASKVNTGIKIYRNGIALPLTYASSGVYTAMSNTTSSFQIARIFPNSGASYASGYMSGLNIWNRELSSTEVKQLYTNPYAMFK